MNFFGNLINKDVLNKVVSTSNALNKCNQKVY